MQKSVDETLAICSILSIFYFFFFFFMSATAGGIANMEDRLNSFTFWPIDQICHRLFMNM